MIFCYENYNDPSWQAYLEHEDLWSCVTDPDKTKCVGQLQRGDQSEIQNRNECGFIKLYSSPQAKNSSKRSIKVETCFLRVGAE